MGKTPVEQALLIAHQIQNMTAQLETELQLARGLEEKRIEAERERQTVEHIDQLDPEAIRQHVAELLESYIVPVWTKINRLHRLQGRCFRLEKS